MVRSDSLEDRLAAIESLMSSHGATVRSLLIDLSNNVTNLVTNLAAKQTALEKMVRQVLDETKALNIKVTNDYVNINADVITLETSGSPEDVAMDVVASDFAKESTTNGSTTRYDTRSQQNVVSTDISRLAEGDAHRKINCYSNWKKEHNVLEQHSYVLFEKLVKTLPNKEMDHFEAWSQMHIINIMLASPINVKKEVRFPKEGVYVNINMPPVQVYLEPILICITDVNENTSKDLWARHKNSIEKLFQLFANMTLDMQTDVLHNRMSFEQKHNLTWESTDVSSEGRSHSDRSGANGTVADTNGKVADANGTVTEANGHFAEGNKKVGDDNNNSSNKRTANCYVNWSEGHEPLQMHKYISLEEFRDSIELLNYCLSSVSVPRINTSQDYKCDWRILRGKETTYKADLMLYKSELKSKAAHLFDKALKFKVNKKLQFPEWGLYLNTEAPTIQYHIYEFVDKYYYYKTIKGTCEMPNIVDVMKNVACTLVQNRASFEELHKLKWVD